MRRRLRTWCSYGSRALLAAATTASLCTFAAAQDSSREVLLGVTGGPSAGKPAAPAPAPLPPAAAGRPVDAADAGLQLDLARDRIAAGDYARATALLEGIIARGPGSPAAAEARQMLREVTAAAAPAEAREQLPTPAPGPTVGEPTPRNAVPGANRLDDQFRASVGDRIYFGRGSTGIDSRADEVLAQQAMWLKAHPRAVAHLEGHADDDGDGERNAALALERAETVRARLLQDGVPPEQVRVVSFGRDRRVALCGDESCKEENRRVVTVIGPRNREARLGDRRN
jgi:peptidoglycan-associated lipoprotein